MVRGTAPEYIRLNEKTDIWAIGAAIWYLIANRILTGPHQEVHFPEDMPQNLAISAENRGRLDVPSAKPFDGYPAMEKYSDELKTLVARCLNWEQDDRPDSATLRTEIDNLLRDHAEVRKGTDHGPLRMANVEDGLGIGDVSARKRRLPVEVGAGTSRKKKKGDDGDNSEG
jgi:serine/threonine protein kinase